MSRYTGPRLRVVRRLGGADIPGLILPRELRRPYPPGQHGPTQRIKLSDYAIRLREKQKLRAHYGVSEHQLVRYMKHAKRGKGNTGEYLLQILESRLDNVVYRLGFTRTMRAARQMVGHGHVNVNGLRVDVPSYHCRLGDEISIRPTSKHRPHVAAEVAGPVTLPIPSFLERDETNLKGKLKSVPVEGDCPLGINESLVVELYAIAL